MTVNHQHSDHLIVMNVQCRFIRFKKHSWRIKGSQMVGCNSTSTPQSQRRKALEKTAAWSPRIRRICTSSFRSHTPSGRRKQVARLLCTWPEGRTTIVLLKMKKTKNSNQYKTQVCSGHGTVTQITEAKLRFLFEAFRRAPTSQRSDLAP